MDEIARLKATIDFLLEVIDSVSEMWTIRDYVYKHDDDGTLYPGPATPEVAAVIEEAIARKPPA